MVTIDRATTRIGFVGVGRMGANMARCLHDNNFIISSVYDVNHNAADDLAEELSATSNPKLSDVSQHCDVIITVVTNDNAMNAIYFNDENNLLNNAKGKLFINCATVAPSIHKTIRDACDNIGADVLECPMASSIPQARAGELYLMCAGKRVVFNQAEELINTISSQAIYTGEVTTAATIKALVNMVMNINTAGVAEGLGLADALGLDLDLIRHIFSNTGANSRALQTDGEDMQVRGHQAYFSAEHAAKDSNIALNLGKQAGLPMVLAEATKNQYDLLVQYGLGHLDKSGISELTFKDRYPNNLENKN